jgi:hypothetical protein
MHLAQAESQDDATLKIMQTMFSHAMPIQEVPATAHSFLTRGLHMGSLLMIGCIAKHLSVPIINLDALRRFFDEDSAPTEGEGRHTCDLIRNWLVACMQRNRLCPENPGPYHAAHNASIYVTSDGDAEGAPLSDKDTMLRLKKNRVQARSLFLLVESMLIYSQRAGGDRMSWRRRTRCTTRSAGGSGSCSGGC